MTASKNKLKYIIPNNANITDTQKGINKIEIKSKAEKQTLSIIYYILYIFSRVWQK
jgi:hypothetical protein